jgi:two-component sensor histidine kinase
MALVHEQLYKSEDVARILLGPYLETLVGEVFSAFGASEKKIRHKIEIPHLHLDINKVVPLGLIINELVSNALAHAFPGNKSGSVALVIRNDEKEIEARISDTGRGMPPSVDFNSPDTLGLKLVKTLVREQLEGIIRLRRSEGARYTLRFPA